MQYGEYVVEQVFDAQAEGFQVAPGGARQVGTAPRVVVVISDAVRGGCRRPRSGVSRFVVITIASDTARGAIGQQWSEIAGSAVVVTSDTARGGVGLPRSGVSRVVVSNIVVVKPCGEKTGAAFDQMQLADVSHETVLRFRRTFAEMLSGR